MSDPIRIGLFEVSNDAINCFRQQECRRPGADTEVVQLVFNIIQQNYTIIDLAEEYGVTYDFGNLLENGSWTGVAKLLLEDKIDLCGLSMRITEERKGSLLFSYPTRYFQSVFIINRPSMTCPKTFVFDAFSPTLWICLLCSLLLCFFSVLLIRSSQESSFYSAFINSLRFPVLCDMRCLFFICCTSLFSFFLLTLYYQTKMYAFLASPAFFKIPFYTFTEALDYVESGRGYFSTFDTQSVACPKEVLCERFDAIAQKYPAAEADKRKKFSAGGIYQTQLDTAFLKAPVSWLDTEYSRIVIQDAEAATQLVAYAFNPRQKKLRDSFNRGLFQMLPAVPNINRHGYHTIKEPFQLQYQPQLAPLSLTKQLGQPFRLFSAGLAFCMLVLVVEVVVYNFRVRRK